MRVLAPAKASQFLWFSRVVEAALQPRRSLLEVVTLAYLALLFGWDAHLIPVGGFARAFVSHHGWIEVAFEGESRFRDTCKELLDAGLEVAIPG